MNGFDDFGGRSMNGHGDYGGKKPLGKSNYVRREVDEEALWKQNSQTGINFSKYSNIEVTVDGENQPGNINTFEDCMFHQVLMSHIKRAGYKIPTPVQKYGIPIITNGRDLMACAQTGSGKVCIFFIQKLI